MPLLDVGEAVSPDGVRNQIEGGMLQSISWTLKEAVRVDGTSATAESWADYPILKFSEAPRLSVALIELRRCVAAGRGGNLAGTDGRSRMQCSEGGIGRSGAQFTDHPRRDH